MPLQLHWTDIALRLALTVLASIAIGYNRSERGKAAGFVVQAARLVVDGGICRELVYDLLVQRRSRTEMPDALRALMHEPGISRLQWDTPS